MKKTIPFLICMVVFTSAFSQISYHGNDKIIGNAWNTNRRAYQNDHDRRSRISERDMEIQRISKRYDYEIQMIARDGSLSRRKRKHAIEALQAQKAEQINSVYMRYKPDIYSYERNHRENDGRYNR